MTIYECGTDYNKPHAMDQLAEVLKSVSPTQRNDWIHKQAATRPKAPINDKTATFDVRTKSTSYLQPQSVLASQTHLNNTYDVSPVPV